MNLARFVLLHILAVLVGAVLVPPRNYADRQYFVVELDTRQSPEALSQFAADYNGTFRYEHEARGLDHHYVFSVAKTDAHAAFLGNHNSNAHDLMRRAPGHEHAHDRLVQYPGLRLVHMMTPRRLERRMPVAVAGGGERRRSIKIVDSAQEPLREVSERLDISDPIFAEQWHLVNTLSPGNDVNVKNVWYGGNRGKGITVAVIDDGLDTESEDLAANFNAAGLWDFNDNTALPNPRLFDDYHGTRCAGEIAAVKNDVCGLGVAYEARVAGIRILSGAVTAEEEAAAMVYGLDANDIYLCSWGPTDNGRTVSAPDALVKKAMIKGIQQGRDARGSVYVFASGNGGRVLDQCNFDGYTNSIYSITVGAIDYQGQHPDYLETCSAVMVVTYSSGGREHIHTTDIKKRCASTHGGTSAAAPLAAGVYALVLAANPDLTWRDVQYVSARAAVAVNEDDGDYQMTAFGEKYSHKYGYGKLDAEKIVEVAAAWKNVKPQAWYYSDVLSVGQSVTTGKEDSQPLSATITVTPEDLAAMNFETVEHVTVKVNIALHVRGRIAVKLVSPTGIVSTLAQYRPVDNSNEPLADWIFMSVAHLGESGVGDWRLEVVSGADNKLEFKDWQLRLFGECADTEKAETFDLDTDYAAVRRDRMAHASPPADNSEATPVDLPAPEPLTTSSADSSLASAANLDPSTEPEDEGEDEHDQSADKSYMFGHAQQYLMALTVFGFIMVIVLMKCHKGPGNSRRRRREDFEFDIIPGEDYSDSDTDHDSLELHSLGQDDADRQALFEEFNAETLPDYDDDMFQIGDEDDHTPAASSPATPSHAATTYSKPVPADTADEQGPVPVYTPRSLAEAIAQRSEAPNVPAETGAPDDAPENPSNRAENMADARALD